MTNHHNAYLLARYERTNNYTVDYDGTIDYEYAEINPPIIGKQYHEDDICWELSQLTYDDDMPDYYECVFVQIDDNNFRLVSFTTK